jgi:Mce-associated membrane protein
VAIPRPVASQGSAQRALSAHQGWTPRTLVPAKDAVTSRRALKSVLHPSWLFAGLSVVLAAAILMASMVMWKGAQEGRTLASSQVAASAAASTTVQKLLGYDYRTFDKHTIAVSALLTGRFKSEFVQAATTVVKPLAVQNQAVVVATVSQASVMSTPDQQDVKILLFVDQRTTSAKLAAPQIDQNRVMLTMSQVAGRWLVSKIEAF